MEPERRKGAFRYRDTRGQRIRDEATLARIEALAIPPAWKDVWISPRSTAKLQATGYDAAGRKQYLYHRGFRAAAGAGEVRQPHPLRRALAGVARGDGGHFDQDDFDRERVSASPSG